MNNVMLCTHCCTHEACMQWRQPVPLRAQGMLAKQYRAATIFPLNNPGEKGILTNNLDCSFVLVSKDSAKRE